MSRQQRQAEWGSSLITLTGFGITMGAETTWLRVLGGVILFLGVVLGIAVNRFYR